MDQTPATRFVEVLGRLGYKTQQQIADLLEIARPTAGTIVRYEKPPSYESIVKLKGIHPEVNMEWIFTGKSTAFVTGDGPATMRVLPPTPPTAEQYADLLEENRRLREQLANNDGKLVANEEQITWLRAQVGGKPEASADAAGEDAPQPPMAASRNHDYVEPVIEEMPYKRAVGFDFGNLNR